MTTQQWHDLLQGVRPGQQVTLRYEGPIYDGAYETFVQKATDQWLVVDMPLVGGRLVLLPVGAVVHVALPHVSEEVALCIHRRIGGPERAFELAPCPVTSGRGLPNKLDDWPVEQTIPPVEVDVPVLAVTSGKGGVGKSTFVVNVAVALAEQGYRPCIIDADLGTANVDVLLKLAPPFNLGDVILGKKHMVEVIVEGPKGIVILPGGSGLRALTTLTESEYAVLTEQFMALHDYADIILIDTGSGVSPGVTSFVKASTAAVLITTPEPPAVTDAYALLKVLAEDGSRRRMHLLVNRAHSIEEGKVTMNRMQYAAQRFLQYELEPLGVIKEHGTVSQAVRQQTDIISGFPRSEAADEWRNIAAALISRLGWEQPSPSVSSPTFIQRLKSYFTAAGRGRPGD